MKPRCSTRRNRALTLVEVLAVLFVLAVIAAALLPVLGRAKRISSRLGCFNNLKEISLDYRIWGGDNGDLYPTGVSVTNGGAMELAAKGDVAAVFQVMSNELSTPKILACPMDTNHFPATNFSVVFSAKNISYFASLDATNDSNSHLLLIGDDNFSVDGTATKSELLNLSANSSVEWLPGRHVSYNAHFWTSTHRRFMGNVVLNDGSVWQFNSDDFQNALANSDLATNHLAIP
jgi:prepilin-type N-terminal cleavage/methylation domain-containing protein